MDATSFPQSQDSQSQEVGSGGFVGRQQEMKELRSALHDALAGQGRLVMLAGEPGIGKTRTAQELAALAENQGAPVLWGRCYDGEGAPSYWPWIQLLRSYVEPASPERLRVELGPGAASIAEIVPQVPEKLTSLVHAPSLEPEQARFRLFDSVAAFLKNVARPQGLVLVLEDLHWADQPSLLLLQFLAREMARSRLLLLCCYRDVELSRQHPLSDALAQLDREPVSRRILLRGLSREDTGSLISAQLKTSPALELVEAIYTRTQGNPFFMTEVIRFLQPPGDATEGRTAGLANIRIPQGVHEVIGQRLNRLSESCNQVLSTASIIGREFEFKLLLRLSGAESDEGLLGVIDEALASHLIEEVPGTAERYQFSHVLVQETLASELSAARRVRLHARIAEALEEHYGSEAADHAGELVYHLLEAEPVLGFDKLVRYSLLAGEQALASSGYEEALMHFQRGLTARGISLTEGTPATDAQTAALLFGLGQAQFATYERSRSAEADASLGRAFEYYFNAGDTARAIDVALYYYSAISSRNRRQRVARALTIAPQDSIEEGRLMACHIALMGDAPADYQEIQALSRQALDLARRHGDQTLEMRILVATGHACAHQLKHQEVLEVNLPALALAQSLGDFLEEAHAHFEVANAHLALGNLREAEEHVAAMITAAEKSRHDFWLSRSQAMKGVVRSARGNWRDAREFSDRSLEIFPEEPGFLANRAVLEYQMGQFEQGQYYVERMLAIMRQNPSAYPSFILSVPTLALSLIAYVTGRPQYPETAREYGEMALASPAAPPLGLHRSHLGLGLLAVVQSDARAASAHYRTLEPLCGTMPITQGAYLALPAVDRVLGLLAYTMGDLNRAITHFDDALLLCRKGYRPELAWTCHDYAAILSQRNAAGDGIKARSLLEESLALATQLGIPPLMDKVAILQESLLARPLRPPAYPDGLSQREVEVLRLIAVGKTDREIAEELVISSHTVNNHVRSILNKTSAANRAEAAAYAVIHGLT